MRSHAEHLCPDMYVINVPNIDMTDQTRPDQTRQEYSSMGDNWHLKIKKKITWQLALDRLPTKLKLRSVPMHRLIAR